MRLDVSTDPGESAPSPGRMEQLIELSVFLCLILPSMGASFFVLRQARLSFPAAAVSSILNDFSLTVLVLFFAWRNGEPFGSLGWTRRRWLRELGWGVLLFFPAVYATGLLEAALLAAGFPAPARLPLFQIAGPYRTTLALILVIVVAVAEETIFRGYLILRFMTATGRAGAAVLLAAAVFSMGHGYEGPTRQVGVFFLGILLGLIYLWRGSLVAPMALHFLVDFNSIVLAALLRPQG